MTSQSWTSCRIPVKTVPYIYMSLIPAYPEFAPLSLEMAQEISPHMVKLLDGISEFSFAGLYLFRHRYNYRASISGDLLILSGERDGSRFFITPCCSTGKEIVEKLFSDHDYWKLISPAFLEKNSQWMRDAGYEIQEDRDNFDYLYLRDDLAHLSGKKFHKKKNHVNAFLSSYPSWTIKDLNGETRKDALEVLEAWVLHEEEPQNTDYEAAREVLSLMDHFPMTGQVLYVDGTPIAWTLAETLGDGLISAVHFEKARTEYRGSYQFINYAYARSLPDSIKYINREQDLGDEGMRQAKMTYRPSGFVMKYRVNRP